MDSEITKPVSSNTGIWAKGFSRAKAESSGEENMSTSSSSVAYPSGYLTSKVGLGRLNERHKGAPVTCLVNHTTSSWLEVNSFFGIGNNTSCPSAPSPALAG